VAIETSERLNLAYPGCVDEYVSNYIWISLFHEDRQDLDG